VAARVVGVLARFPSIPPRSAGFVVADEATLASALEAQMPGQGAADEVWLSTPRLGALRAALATGPLAALSTTYRDDVQHALSAAPVARAVMFTLIGASGLAAVLAVIGLVVALLGGLRDRALEDDLLAQGMGPRALRAEMRLRLAFAAAIGVGCGVIVALALARLAVAVVQAAGEVASPDPPLTAIAPVPLLAAWALAALVTLVAAGWLASIRLPHRSAL
jgi:purine-cytosine permease-like protein